MGYKMYQGYKNGFNTQPPEGGWNVTCIYSHASGGFNTQPPEGGWEMDYGCGHIILVFQHTAARRRLGWHSIHMMGFFPFQHTAARRRLVFRDID